MVKPNTKDKVPTKETKLCSVNLEKNKNISQIIQYLSDDSVSSLSEFTPESTIEANNPDSQLNSRPIVENRTGTSVMENHELVMDHGAGNEIIENTGTVTEITDNNEKNCEEGIEFMEVVPCLPKERLIKQSPKSSTADDLQVLNENIWARTQIKHSPKSDNLHLKNLQITANATIQSDATEPLNSMNSNSQVIAIRNNIELTPPNIVQPTPEIDAVESPRTNESPKSSIIEEFSDDEDLQAIQHKYNKKLGNTITKPKKQRSPIVKSKKIKYPSIIQESLESDDLQVIQKQIKKSPKSSPTQKTIDKPEDDNLQIIAKHFKSQQRVKKSRKSIVQESSDDDLQFIEKSPKTIKFEELSEDDDLQIIAKNFKPQKQIKKSPQIILLNSSEDDDLQVVEKHQTKRKYCKGSPKLVFDSCKRRFPKTLSRKPFNNNFTIYKFSEDEDVQVIDEITTPPHKIKISNSWPIKESPKSYSPELKKNERVFEGDLIPLNQIKQSPKSNDAFPKHDLITQSQIKQSPKYENDDMQVISPENYFKKSQKGFEEDLQLVASSLKLQKQIKQSPKSNESVLEGSQDDDLEVSAKPRNRFKESPKSIDKFQFFERSQESIKNQTQKKSKKFPKVTFSPQSAHSIGSDLMDISRSCENLQALIECPLKHSPITNSSHFHSQNSILSQVNVLANKNNSPSLLKSAKRIANSSEFLQVIENKQSMDSPISFDSDETEMELSQELVSKQAVISQEVKTSSQLLPSVICYVRSDIESIFGSPDYMDLTLSKNVSKEKTQDVQKTPRTPVSLQRVEEQMDVNIEFKSSESQAHAYLEETATVDFSRIEEWIKKSQLEKPQLDVGNVAMFSQIIEKFKKEKLSSSQSQSSFQTPASVKRINKHNLTETKKMLAKFNEMKKLSSDLKKSQQDKANYGSGSLPTPNLRSPLKAIENSQFRLSASSEERKNKFQKLLEIVRKKDVSPKRIADGSELEKKSSQTYNDITASNPASYRSCSESSERHSDSQTLNSVIGLCDESQESSQQEIDFKNFFDNFESQEAKMIRDEFLNNLDEDKEEI